MCYNFNMKSKKLLLILIFVLILLFFAFYKISAQNTSPNNPDIENIKNLIQEKTPAFIAKPIIDTTNALENFRKDMGEKSNFKLVSFIFNNQIIFYLVLFGSLFIITRFIWNKIF